MSIPQPSFAEQKRRRGEPLQAGDPVSLDELIDDHLVRRMEVLGQKKLVAKESKINARTVSRRLNGHKLVYRVFCGTQAPARAK